MIGLIQRVSTAQVSVEDDIVGKIDRGILLLLGIEKDDTEQHAIKLFERVVSYRIFADQAGKMNCDLRQVGGQLLVVSQFTLVADTNKGRRPSFSSAASPQKGEDMYQYFLQLVAQSGLTWASGRFGADMQVALVNDGPVTFSLRV